MLPPNMPRNSRAADDQSRTGEVYLADDLLAPPVAAVAAPPDSISPPINPPVASAPASAIETIPLRSPLIDPSLPSVVPPILLPESGKAL